MEVVTLRRNRTNGTAALKPVLVSPDVEGAYNWQPMAFDASKGVVMPSFGDKLNLSQPRAVQAYVLSRAAATKAAGR